MRTEHGYKFTLQFPANTDEQQMVGELLEGLGSRKSRLIVTALSEYIQTHPETGVPGGQAEQAHPPGITKDDVLAIVREELAKEAPASAGVPGQSQAESVDQGGIEFMLGTLGSFT